MTDGGQLQEASGVRLVTRKEARAELESWDFQIQPSNFWEVKRTEG